MGLVLQFQSLPPDRRQSSSQLHNQINRAEGKTADIVIFPGVRQLRSPAKKELHCPLESIRAHEWPAE